MVADILTCSIYPTRNKCVLCFKAKEHNDHHGEDGSSDTCDEPLSTATEKGYSSVTKAADIRRDETYEYLKSISHDVENPIKYHRKCFAKYTSKWNLKLIGLLGSDIDEDGPAVKRRRSTAVSMIWELNFIKTKIWHVFHHVKIVSNNMCWGPSIRQRCGNVLTFHALILKILRSMPGNKLYRPYCIWGFGWSCLPLQE